MENMKIYDPTLDVKTCCHSWFEMVSSDLHSDCRYLRYLRYIDSKN